MLFLTYDADIDECTAGSCMSAPFLLWVALDVSLVFIATVLVAYGEVNTFSNQ